MSKKSFVEGCSYEITYTDAKGRVTCRAVRVLQVLPDRLYVYSFDDDGIRQFLKKNIGRVLNFTTPGIVTPKKARRWFQNLSDAHQILVYKRIKGCPISMDEFLPGNRLHPQEDSEEALSEV